MYWFTNSGDMIRNARQLIFRAKIIESVHITLAKRAKNAELVSLLNNVYERTRYWSALNIGQLRQLSEGRLYDRLTAHRMIAEVVVELVRLAFSELYVH